MFVDRARRKEGPQHGGDDVQITLNGSLLSKSTTVCSEDLLALDEAMGKFKTIDPTKAELVRLLSAKCQANK